MNKEVNRINRMRLSGIRKELFDIANSYAGNEHGHVACRLHGISNSVYNIRDIMEVLYPDKGTPAESRYGRDVKKLTCGNCEKFKLVSKYDSRPSLDCEKPGYGTLATNNPCDRFEPKPKSLAQYLGEYIEHEIELGNISDDVSEFAYNSWRELLEQALDAYESTEDVKIRIERA